MAQVAFIAGTIALIAAGICTAQAWAMRLTRLTEARHVITVPAARRDAGRRARR